MNTLKTTITVKFLRDLRKVSISLIAKDSPIPKMGPIKGEINMAPITTAVELAFNPIEAINMEQMRIQDVWPLKGISAIMDSLVAAASVLERISKSSERNFLTLARRPYRSFFTSSPLS